MLSDSRARFGSSGDATRALTAAIGAASEETLGAAIERSHEAQLLADLASAFAERGKRRNQPCDFAVAFSAASRAVVIDPERLDSRFDIAVALEQLHLRVEARRAFQDYLAHDLTSPRADTARAHLGRLVAFPSIDEVKQRAASAIEAKDIEALARVVASAPQPVRLMGEEGLLGEWADAYRNADIARSRHALAGAELIGKTLVRSGGDRALLDSVSAIKAASNDHASLVVMATAYGEYRDARQAYAVKRDEHARSMMRAAAHRLDTFHSPLSSRAWVYVATIGHYFGDNDNSLATITRVLRSLSGRERAYPAAAGQALWTRGLIFLSLGRPHAALGSYAAARDVLLPTREASSIAGIETVFAEMFAYLGDEDSAWRHRVEALRWAEATTDYTRRQTTYSEAAAAALTRDYRSLAELLTRNVATHAAEAHDPVFIAEAALMQSRILLARQQPQEALSVLTDAADKLEHQAASGSILRLRANVAIARGEALVALDPAAALGVIKSALEGLDTLHNRTRTVHAYDLIGAARERLGNVKAAEEAYRAGIAEIESQRASLPNDQDRSTFTDTGRALYDHVIRLLIASGNSEDALPLVRRARSLGIPSPTINPDERRREIPATAVKATTVEYYVVSDSILIWTTSPGEKTRFDRRMIAEASLNKLVAESVESIVGAGHAVDSRPAAGRLFNLLLGSIIRDQPSTGDIVIAPHGVLHRVPFVALYDPSKKRYLIQSHSVVIALGDRAEEDEQPYRSALIVAASAAGTDLPPLRNVATEARIAARAFPAAQILSGSKASPSVILHDAGAYDAVHFAGHAVWNERQPHYGALRLAADPHHPDGILYAEELNSEQFAHTRLVVLAACDTARGRLSGAGMLGFARAFMAAGVPRVIGTLWPIDDDASVILFHDFYDHVRRGTGAAEALRRAQCAAIAKGHAPSQWAAFQLYESGIPLANRDAASVK